ncbi:flagellar basal body rod protein FlgC [Pelagerythrobacter rhizovicinus]|nr:flagellar basal body rod protein FlgC [Pelagerythrobacter rhizovicinus]
MTLFDLGQRAMSAQLVRMNAAASNLANAGSVAGSEEQAYRPLRPVFAEHLDTATGMSTVRVDGVYRADVAPVRRHEPGHPLADANGDVWASPVDENAEMVEMLEASRQYQNMVEALSTAKQLMLETMRMK